MNTTDLFDRCRADVPLHELTDAELEIELRRGTPGAETEHSVRIYCRRLGITDLASVLPSWKLTGSGPQPSQFGETRHAEF